MIRTCVADARLWYDYSIPVRLWARFRTPCVLKGIHHSFFQSYSFKMSLPEAALQYFKDLHTKIFGSRHVSGEFLQRIQILQVVPGEQFPLDKAIKVDQIADHASVLVHWPADRYFQDIVVSVSMGIITFPVNGAIFFGREFLAVQAVGSGESVAPCEVSLHASP